MRSLGMAESYTTLGESLSRPDKVGVLKLRNGYRHTGRPELPGLLGRSRGHTVTGLTVLKPKLQQRKQVIRIHASTTSPPHR